MMAVLGQIDPTFKELNEARENLARSLRGIGAHENVLEAIDRYIEAKIRVSVNRRY